MRPEFEQVDPNPILPKVLLAVGLLAIAGLAYFLWQSSQPDPSKKIAQAPPPAAVVVEPEPVIEPELEAPVVAETTEPEPKPDPLPALSNSDTYVINKLAELSAGDALVKLLIPDNLLLKSVRAVMALDEGLVVHDYRPAQSPAPAFKVSKINEPLDIDIGQRYTLSPENYQRYQPWVSVLSSIDKKTLASLYQRLSPLLEEAYQQHGIDRGNFHNVLLTAMDSLLAAPVMAEEIVLVQPKVFYQYQDPMLEKAPQAHRLLWRMGPENTKAIQASLRELKQELLALNIPRK
jgi:hypothetical protein